MESKEGFGTDVRCSFVQRKIKNKCPLTSVPKCLRQLVVFVPCLVPKGLHVFGSDSGVAHAAMKDDCRIPWMLFIPVKFFDQLLSDRCDKA